jgi:hypothetical protein
MKYKTTGRRIQMLKRNLVLTATAALCLLGQPIATLFAQPSQPQSVQAGSLLADTRTSIIRAIGAQDQTVELAVLDHVLTVLRVNSNMNEATHAGRDNEATAIAAIVSKAIAGKPEFKNVVTIVVQYVARSAPGGQIQVVDTVEFRQDANGIFQFHRT